MRFDQEIDFIKIVKDKYNPDTSQHETELKTVGSMPCHSSDLGLERSQQVFGDYKTGRKIVRLEWPFEKDYDKIRFENEDWHVEATRLEGAVLYIERDNI